MKAHPLKPQDLLVALKILFLRRRGAALKQTQIGHELVLSQSEVSAAIARLQIARLVTKDLVPLAPALKEVVIHGVQYFLAAELGQTIRGMRTATSHPAVGSHFLNTETTVWPFAEGDSRGQSLVPLYHSAPQAAQNDDQLYHSLALIDMLRIGRQREVAFAKDALSQIIGGD